VLDGHFPIPLSKGVEEQVEENSQQHRENNKQRVLTQGVSSMVRSIAHAASNPTKCETKSVF